MSDPGQAPPPHAPPPSPGTAQTPYGPVSPFQKDRSVEPPGSSGTEKFVYVACCVVSGLVAAFPAAWLWTQLIDVPKAKYSRQGVAFIATSTETAFDHVTAITLWFFVVGLGFGLVLGFVAALLGRRHGWVSVLAILVMSWVGASVSAWFGVAVLGPDNAIDFVALFNGTASQRTEMLNDFEFGDVLASTVALSTPIALLGWPTGGMIGALAGASVWPKTAKAPRGTGQFGQSVPLS